MAARHGHVYNIESVGEQCSNLDIAAASSIDTTSIGPRFQLDMRNTHIRRALYKMVTMGNAVGLLGRRHDCHIWSDSLADALTG